MELCKYRKNFLYFQIKIQTSFMIASNLPIFPNKIR
jgi:hypothetical protein